MSHYDGAGGYGYSSDTEPRYARERDQYRPQQYGMRDYAARDGYANDEYAQSYAQSRGYGGNSRPASTYGVEDTAQPRYERYERRIEYPVDQYSRRGGDDRDRGYERDDRRSYYEREDDRRVARRERSGSRREERRHKRHDDESEEEEHEDGNSEIKKWGATLAGAAVGGFAGRTAKKDNWIAPAIGAVVGGLIAREGEKEFYKRRERKHEEEREERSQSAHR